MRKEFNAAHRRTHQEKRRKVLWGHSRGVLRQGIRLIAVVSILGSAAYLLFTRETTEAWSVKAREAKSVTVPREAVQSTTSEPAEVSHQTLQPPTVSSLPQSAPLQILSGLPTVLEKASPQQRDTANRLQGFATTGDMTPIREVTREDIRSLADLLVAELGDEALAAAVESHLGLPADRFLADGRPAERLADVFEAIRTENGPTNTLPLVFSDQVEANGLVTGNVHVIPAGTRRIYAAFENAGGLQGLDQVLAVWRNPADDRMVFTEYEPVRTGSAYNYVWLELDEGWPAGFYQLDLFHPAQNSQRLASRSFNVR